MTTTTTLTGYAAAKLVNAELEKVGITKPIPPQMMYNYTSQRLAAGKEPFIKYDPKKGIDPVDLDRWTKEYVAGRVAKLVKGTTVETEEEALESVES
jgi:hypothetical protein